MSLINELFFRLSKSVGAFSIKLVDWRTTGGMMRNAKTTTNIRTKPKIAETEAPRLKPRLRKNSTAGFKPIAKKIEIIINTKIWLAAANERSNTKAVSAPVVARNPK